MQTQTISKRRLQMSAKAEVKKQIVMPSVSVFNRWTTEGIEITDPGLRPYIGLKSVIVPRSSGRHAQHQFHKSQLNIVERFMNHKIGRAHV